MTKHKLGMLSMLGLILILAVMACGFLPIDDAAWRAWRMAWSFGAGMGIGIGVGLIIVDLARANAMD